MERLSSQMKREISSLCAKPKHNSEERDLIERNLKLNSRRLKMMKKSKNEELEQQIHLLQFIFK